MNPSIPGNSGMLRPRMLTVGFSALAVVLAAAAPPADIPVSEIITRLQGTDVAAQIAAASDAAALGPYASDAVDALIAGLSSDNPAVKFECTMALGAVGLLAGDAREALTAMLSPDQPVLAVVALESLRRIGNPLPATIGAARELAESDRRGVQVAALRFLAVTGELSERQTQERLPVLIQALSDEDQTVGRDAVAALVEASGAAVPALTSALDADSSLTRLRACVALGWIGPEADPAADVLVRLTGADDERLARAAVDALGRIGTRPDTVVPVLTRLLRSPSAAQRADAADAIARYGDAAAAAASALRSRLRDDDSLAVQTAAAAALGRLGDGEPETVTALLDALSSEHGAVTVSAANALAEIGEPAVAGLSQLLTDASYQDLAVTILGEMGEAAAPAVPALVELLQGDNEALKREVFIALSSIGPPAQAASNQLLDILRDESSGLARRGAAWTLARIGDQNAVPVLEQVYRTTQDPLVARVCVWALVTLMPDNDEYAQIAVPKLIPALEDEQELVRREALTALGRLGSRAKAAVPEVLRVARDDDSPGVRAAALAALGRIGSFDRAVAQVATSALEDDDASVRNAARFLAGSMGPAAAAASGPLMETLEHGAELDRIVAAWALVRVAPSDNHRAAALQWMLRALDYPDQRVRAEAATTLGMLKVSTPEVRAALQAVADGNDPDAASAAQNALEQLGTP